METLITLAVVVLVTAIAVAGHLRRSRRAGAPAQATAAKCPRCGAAFDPQAARCPGCGVPRQIFEVSGARAVSTEAVAAGGGKVHAVVRADVCVGCSTCVPACPVPGAIRMEGKLAVVDPNVCDGVGACAEACPVGGILLSAGGAVHRVEVPDLGADFQSNVRGVWIAGELGGRGLIKNAINEGRIAAEAVARDLGRLARGPGSAAPDDDTVPYDVAIVGSGPAGLSAGLESHRRDLRYVILEQGSLADSIRRYPRHKLLLAEPVTVPLYGDLWIADANKETLLEVWETVIESTGLRVRTGVRVGAVEREGGLFRLTGDGWALRARRVILALGRRGTPRRLGVPGEKEGSVFYDVAEMEEFRGSRVVVVGGGDSAIESAVGLSNQPGTTVVLSYRKGDFSRAKERNVAKLEAAERSGRLSVLRCSEITAIRPGEVDLLVDGVPRTLPTDHVIVRIGGEPPTRFLGEVGVRFVTKEIPIAEAREAVHA